MSRQDFGKVALLMGGWSAERVISLKSGAAVLKALQHAKIDVEVVDVDIDIVQVLQQGGYDRAFNILHGRGGEDGQIQALLELLNIPYTGTGILGSALAMDKMRSKFVWRGAGLPTPKACFLNSEEDCKSILENMSLPLAVKPTYEGSSVGISKVTIEEDLLPAWRQASKFGQVMAEQWIVGEEYTVAILNGEALPAIRLEVTRDFYDYKAKYDDAGTQYHCPCGLESSLEQEIQELSLEAFSLLNGRSWGRIDLIIDGDKQPWLIESNTVPGMTDHSLVPMAAKAHGLSFNDLVLEILATADKSSGEIDDGS